MFLGKLIVFPAAFLLATAGASPVWAERIPLAAHRAVYELTLDPGKVGTRVDTARGRIAYEMTGNLCEGYSVTLRQVTELDTGEGKKTTSDLRSSTWEDGTARTFRFKNQNYVNQELRDDVDGTAERAQDGGLSVRLVRPKFGPLKFGGPILLPTEQLVRILDTGEKGERLLEAKIFDGSPDGKKSYDTLSLIGEGITGRDSEVEEAARVATLSSIKRFPVTVSYFEMEGTGERTPAYTLSFELYENGVSRALKLDYGTFALRGEMKNIEFLKSTSCIK